MRPAAEAPRAARGRLITAATVAVAMLVTAPAADGSFPGRNGDIAFDAKFDCGYERTAIGVMGPDGSARRQISECEWGTHGPAWSPDGRSLLYSSYSGTWLTSADGSERRRTSGGWDASFAPDGLHYAYVHYAYMRSRGRRWRIWRTRIDGGDNRYLRAGRSPLWSPDGRTIAYYPERMRRAVRRKGVWIMNARTGERLRRVAPRWMTPLDWSPDGRRLLCRGFADGSDLYTVRADGKRRPRRLTRTPARSELQAAWSPDGRRIVFGAETRPDNDFQHFILTMSARGSDETVIWAGQRFDEFDEDNYIQTPNVSWQPLPD
jgi:Tol biopolymer transport system component